jgi:oligopeptide/dipeptide ABC transporter ATP-binding protein
VPVESPPITVPNEPTTTSAPALLAIRGLGLRASVSGAELVRGVDLTVRPGQVHGLVGETGAGKSLTAWSVLGLLPAGVRRVAGTIHLAGRELPADDEAQLRAVRGRDVAMIVQNPKTALVPTMSVGRQLALVHRARTGSTRRVARQAALEALADVRIPDPHRRYHDYPHQFSGGQAQRVVIAMALLNRPKLVIADEATTGLDVTVQTEVLDLLVSKLDGSDAALLLITHDLGVVANYADTTTTMFAGEVIESGSTRTVFEAPAHPYLRGLLVAADLSRTEQRRRHHAVSGAPPNLLARPKGCQFGYRCPWHEPECGTQIALVESPDGRFVRCRRASELDRLEASDDLS